MVLFEMLDMMPVYIVAITTPAPRNPKRQRIPESGRACRLIALWPEPNRETRLAGSL
jgi:hypothetical protein